MGQDFTLSRNQLSFQQGANDGNTITFFIDVLDDLLVEGTENIILSGSVESPTVSGAVFVGGPVTVSIFDDEGK